MMRLARPLSVTLSSTLAAMILVSPVWAQTVPPGPASPAPNLPASDVMPPNTDLPAALGDVPMEPVVFGYFGPSAVVDEILDPPMVVTTDSVGCYSGPNATSDEESSAELFDVAPAGSEWIPFFVRGTRAYAASVDTGAYCWVDAQFTVVD